MSARPAAIRPISIAEPTVRHLPALTRLRRPAGALAACQPGDRLWVREAFHLEKPFDHLSPTVAASLNKQPVFAAALPLDYSSPNLGRRRFARELPRVWHRQYLLLTGVAREHLQAITDAEIRAEGYATRADFARAWDANLSLSGWAGCWAEDPVIVVLDFIHVPHPLPDFAPPAEVLP